MTEKRHSSERDLSSGRVFRTEPDGPRGSRLASPISMVALHHLLLCVLSFAAFWWHGALLFNGLDGANMLTHAGLQFQWTNPAAGFSATPFQGLTSIWFNFNAWLSPGFVLPYLVFGEGSTVERMYQVSAYMVHALLLFSAILVLCRSLAITWPVALGGAWATILLILPVFGTPLLYPILQLQPNLAFTIAQALFIVAAMSFLGRGADTWRSSINWRTGVILIVLFALSAHLMLMSPTAVILCLPFFLFAGIALLFGAHGGTELAVKIAGALAIVILLLVTGFAEYVLGIFSFSGARYFPTEFENTRSSWYFVSVLLQANIHGPGGTILVVLGLIGLVQGAFFAERRVKWFARAMLGFACLIIGFGAATVLIDFWRGPSPVYFEAMLWPVYALFAIRLLFSGFSVFRGRVMQRSNGPTMTHESSPTILALLAAVPVAIVLASYPVGRADLARHFVYPQSQPELVKILRDSVALEPGKAIQGRVATFQLQDKGQPASWADIHNADTRRMMQSGNDFHLIGLWSYGIPTLSEYAPTISPALYVSVTRLLALPEDQQVRSAFVLRRVDANVLATFGVRYVITDEPKAPPLRLVHIESEDLSEPVYLYEVPNAIQGIAAPRNFRRTETFSSALKALPDLSDPKDTAIVMDADVGNIELSALSPAIDPVIRPVAGGFEISASSPGQSLLVVPMLFSHCLSFYADASGAGPGEAEATLMRVNAIQTGILFEGQLKGELRYFTGPFDGSGCRLQDAADFSNMWASSGKQLGVGKQKEADRQ